MAADLPQVTLAELVSRHGPAGVTAPGRCESLLLDACGSEFHSEIAGLAAAADQGIVRALQNSALSSEPRALLVDRLSRQLAKNSELSPYMARWSVECWALALQIVHEDDYLMTTKLTQIQPLIDAARVDGALPGDAIERRVGEARSRGIDEADARAHLARYLVRRETRSPARAASTAARRFRVRPESRPLDAALVERPATAVGTSPEADSARQASPPAKLRTRTRIVVISALCLLFATIAAAVGPSVRSAYIAGRERRTYEAARGNVDALAAYLNDCELCAFGDAARAEASRLRTATEEKIYRAAGRDPQALQSYTDGCTICAFKPQALSEIMRVREEQAYHAAQGHRDALRSYLAECRVCAFGDAARSELAELSRIADDEQTYRSARGTLTALRAYLGSCGRCAFRQPALEEVRQLELLAVRPPPGSPDLAGVVRGAASAATLYVIVSSRNPRVVSTQPGETLSVHLFGIVDPLGKSAENPHVAVLRGYLDKAQRKIECFAREEQTFQCFADGNDLAILALHDGIAKPGPNALSEYKQSAR